jgi:hypothetical protein
MTVWIPAIASMMRNDEVFSYLSVAGKIAEIGMPVNGWLALTRVVLKLRRTTPLSYHLEIIVWRTLWYTVGAPRSWYAPDWSRL